MIAAVLSPLGRGVAIAAVLVGSFVWWLSVHDSRVAERVVTNINKSAENLSEKAVENRNRGDVPDALAKLRGNVVAIADARPFCKAVRPVCVSKDDQLTEKTAKQLLSNEYGRETVCGKPAQCTKEKPTS